MTDKHTIRIKPSWDPANLIADKLKLNRRSVGNVINLLDNGATIPFIARYRKDMTGDMGPDMLREVVAGVEELRSVEAKIQNVYKSVVKQGVMTPDLDTSLRTSTTLVEVESLYAAYKPGHTGTYAERAKALGLEPLARALMDGQEVNLMSAVNVKVKGLATVGDMEKGVKHIIADIVAKDKEVREKARSICQNSHVLIESSKVKEKNSLAKKKEKIMSPKTAANKEKAVSQHKFDQFFDYKISVNSVRPHQILALNRGEDLKILTIKITIPEAAKKMLINFAKDMFLQKVRAPRSRELIMQAVEDAYDRLIEPMLSRQIRSDLTKSAEKESILVFSSNLKKLLLTPPVKNKTILGIDPGFTNGCKLAVISSTSQVLETGVAYLHTQTSNRYSQTRRIADMVDKHRCEVITIGNGVACRETEQVISDMIKQGQFYSRDVVYCIVDECGASIYSISPEAQKDLPELDPTLRGAVSLARRLQDPLAELVKIEPKHLGVGMYQHDLNKTKLHAALSSVVEECVSFVGVDVNTCSHSILKHVAGLNDAKARNLLEWRAENGFFTNREQLLSVGGLGKKTFEQCAGFIRISKNSVASASKKSLKQMVDDDVKKEECEEEKPTKGRKRKAEASGPSKRKKAKIEDPAEWNPLDATAIHPESYELSYKLASHLSVDIRDVGTSTFISQVKSRSHDSNLKALCEKEQAGLATVQLIVEALMQPLLYDLRESFQKPLFKQEIKSVFDLHTGSEVTGRITNVVLFGAFVDVGVGINGFIHKSRMGRFRQLELGDHVTVKVENVDLDRKRIGLFLKNVEQKQIC